MLTRLRPRLGLLARQRALGWLRVAVYVACVLAVLGALSLRRALASAGEASLVVGRELSPIADLLGSAHAVRLNGQSIRVGSTMVDATPREVLDRVEAACRANALDVGEAIADAATRAQVTSTSLGLGIVRREQGDEGVVACLARAQGVSGGYLERLRAVAQTGDLGALGGLRWVHAVSRHGRTHVLSAWTDGHFDLRALALGPLGDAPGDDAPRLPRPASSQRILSARIDGVPYSVRLYRTAMSADAALVDVGAKLAATGHAPATATSARIPSGRAFQRDDADVLVLANDAPGGATVTYLEMPLH